MPILLYKRIWAFVGQIILTGSKGSYAQSIFVYQSHSTKELYSVANLYFVADLYSTADPFPLHFFLWTSLTLWSSWQAFGPCFSLNFLPHGTDSKNGHQQCVCNCFTLPNVHNFIECSYFFFLSFFLNVLLAKIPFWSLHFGAMVNLVFTFW